MIRVVRSRKILVVAGEPIVADIPQVISSLIQIAEWRLVLRPFDPEDFNGNLAAMDAAIDAAALEAYQRGEQLVALVAARTVRLGEGK